MEGCGVKGVTLMLPSHFSFRLLLHGTPTPSHTLEAVANAMLGVRGGRVGRGGVTLRGGRGRGRGGASSLALTRAHTRVLAHEFFVAAPDPRCGWLQLPEPFAQV